MAATARAIVAPPPARMARLIATSPEVVAMVLDTIKQETELR
jgi:hypothetical protein